MEKHHTHHATYLNDVFRSHNNEIHMKIHTNFMALFCPYPFHTCAQGEPNRRYNYIKYSDGRIAGNPKSICHGRLRVKYKIDLFNRSQSQYKAAAATSMEYVSE